MTEQIIDQLYATEPAYLWLGLAALLALLELIVPGVFLVWVAAAAALTGLLSLVIDVSLVIQLIMFGIFTMAAVWGARRWYKDHQVSSENPLLNDRAAQMVGASVTVVESITDTGGRIKFADGEWPARGPAMKKGSIAKVIAVEAGIVRIAPWE